MQEFSEVEAECHEQLQLVVDGCGHGEQWMARDRRWRCEKCEPPSQFEIDHEGVVARRVVPVQLQLVAA